MIMQGATTTDLDADIVAAYEAPFPTPESKAGAAQFPLLVPLTPEETGAAEMISVKHALSCWDKPTLVAFSDGDPITGAMAPILERSFAGAAGREHPTIANAGHFPHLEQPEEFARHVQNFAQAPRQAEPRARRA